MIFESYVFLLALAPLAAFGAAAVLFCGIAHFISNQAATSLK